MQAASDCSESSSIDTSTSGAAEEEISHSNNCQIESEAEEDDEDKGSDVGQTAEAVAVVAEKAEAAAGKHEERGDQVSSCESTLTSKEGRSMLQTTERGAVTSTSTSTQRVRSPPPAAAPKHKEPDYPPSGNALRREFEELNVLEHSRLLKIEDLSEAKRTCKVSSTLLVPPEQTMLRIFLRINFPLGYPSTSPPTFVYGKGRAVRLKLMRNFMSCVLQVWAIFRRPRYCLVGGPPGWIVHYSSL